MIFHSLDFVVFFVAWAGIAARPWVAPAPDPQVAALAQRQQRLQRDAKLVQLIAARRAEANRAAQIAAQAAAQRARTVLDEGGDAFAAALAATVVLEDDPRFNAGTGSNLRLDGKLVQMDAAVIASDGRFGGVACIEAVQNPVLVAARVIETPHLLLVGERRWRDPHQCLGERPERPPTGHRVPRRRHGAGVRHPAAQLIDQRGLAAAGASRHQDDPTRPAVARVEQRRQLHGAADQRRSHAGSIADALGLREYAGRASAG